MGMSTHVKGLLSENGDEMCETFIIKVSEIPEGVEIIKFQNCY